MEKINLIVFALIFLCAFVSHSKGQITPPNKGFPLYLDILNYHTRVDYRNNINNVAAYVEEYYYLYGDPPLGRLDILTGGVKKSYIYDANMTQYSNNQLMEVTSTTCKVIDHFRTNNSYSTQTFGQYGLGYDLWVDKYQKNFARNYLTIGPTAILRRVRRDVSSGALTAIMNFAYESIRGITCTRWTVTGHSIPGITFTIYFTAASWLKFEDLSRRIPVRVTIKGQSNGQQINVDMDYFLFERYRGSGTEVLPPIGVGCVGRRTPVLYQLPDMTTTFSAVIEKFDIYQQNMGAKQLIRKEYVYYDGLLGLLKIEGRGIDTEQADLRSRIIQDFNHGVSYVFDQNEACVIRHIEGSPFTGEQNAVAYLKTAKQILMWSKNTYLIGSTFVRGIFCDVWETVLTNSMIPNDPTQTTVYQTVVITSFILNTDSEYIEQGDDDFDTPIQTLVTAYKVNGQPPNYIMQYSYFEWDNYIYDESDFTDVFNVKNCYTTPDNRKYVDIFVPLLTPYRLSFAQTYYKKFRQSIALALTSAAGISPLRIPFLELDFSTQDVRVNAMIVDRVKLSLSFRKGSLQNPLQTEKNVNAQTIDDCAKQTLQLNGTAFHWCNTASKCYVQTNGNTGGATVNIPTNDCYIYIRDAINGTDASIANTPNLTQAINAIMAIPGTKNAIFSITPEGDDGTRPVSFSIEEVTYSSKTSYDTTGSLLFSVSAPGYKLDTSRPTAINQQSTDDDTLTTVGDCFRRCNTQSNTSIDCVSFSYCRNDDNSIGCVTSGIEVYDKMKDKSTYLKMDSECNTYSMSYLRHFTKVPGQMVLSWGEKNLNTDTANHCAQKCTLNSGFKCKSFQFCGSTGDCFLRRSHNINLTVEKTNPNTALTDCSFYTIDFMADYSDSGPNLIVDQNGIKMHGASPSQCAKMCSEQTANCVSFNFCPVYSPKVKDANSYCVLSTKSINSPNIQTTTSKFCRHYEMIDPNKRPGPVRRSKYPSETIIDNHYNQHSVQSGMTSSGFFGLIFGLLILGMVLGVAGYFGFTYLKKRNTSGGGLGLSVRFMKQGEGHATLENKLDN